MISRNGSPADIDRRIKLLESGSDRDGIERVSDLRGRAFVVLLGEPGIGKSTVLEREAAHNRTTVIKVRELMNGAAVQEGKYLFLDALDEYRVDGSHDDKVHTLANSIISAKPRSWWLTCRSEDWRKSADILPISKTTHGMPITVAQVLPLDLEEASAVLATLGECDPERFLSNARSIGALAFAENPLSLSDTFTETYGPLLLPNYKAMPLHQVQTVLVFT